MGNVDVAWEDVINVIQMIQTHITQKRGYMVQ